MKKALIGYQVYSAREEASKDLLGTLKQLKALITLSTEKK